jgi:hypothetical protein
MSGSPTPQGRFEYSAVLAKIVECVSPYLGQTMAEASVEAQRQRLGITDSRLAAEQVEALITRIGVGLVIFVGRDKTAQVVRQMQDSVRALPGGTP